MFRLLLAALLCLCWTLPASATPRMEEVTPFFSSQYFTWEEYDGGRRLLKESGPLFSAGVVLGAVSPSLFTLHGKVEAFGGSVGYNGETQAPNPVPVRTDVVYYGTKQELDLGYRLSSGPLQVDPFGGVGYRWWLRTLQDSTSASGTSVTGYTEYWRTWYGRVGGRGSYRVSPDLSITAEGGAKYPFYTGNSVDFAGSGTTTFSPVGRWSAFGETGIAYQRLRINLSYDGFRYSHSALKSVGNRFFFQPDSSSDIFGLSIGWAFR